MLLHDVYGKARNAGGAERGPPGVACAVVRPQCWTGTATALGSDLILALGHAGLAVAAAPYASRYLTASPCCY